MRFPGSVAESVLVQRISPGRSDTAVRRETTLTSSASLLFRSLSLPQWNPCNMKMGPRHLPFCAYSALDVTIVSLGY